MWSRPMGDWPRRRRDGYRTTLSLGLCIALAVRESCLVRPVYQAASDSSVISIGLLAVPTRCINTIRHAVVLGSPRITPLWQLQISQTLSCRLKVVFCCFRGYRLHSRCALHSVSLSPWFYARSDDHQPLSLSYQADEDCPTVPRIYASGSLLNRLVIPRDAFAYLP